MTEPLTPEELAELRALPLVNRNGSTGNLVDRLLATLDATRKLADEGLAGLDVEKTTDALTSAEFEVIHDPQRWYAAYDHVLGMEASTPEGREFIYRTWRSALTGRGLARTSHEGLAETRDLETIRGALKGARGLALDSGETDLDAELGRAIDLLDAG